MDKNIPNWSEYLMTIAKAVALRSKDDKTKVGCVIVDKDNRIVSTGYNGMPKGMNETEEIWKKEVKEKNVLHSESAAILYSKQSLQDCKLITTMFPCQHCAKLIAGAGIKEVIYSDDKYDNEVTREAFRLNNIKLRKLGDE